MGRLFVAAFDPGETTGWARWVGEVDPEKDLRSTLRAGAMECGQERVAASRFLDWRAELLLAASMELEMTKWLVRNEFITINGDEHFIVIEDFVLRPGPHSGKRAGLSPVRMTCYLLSHIAENNIVPPPIIAQQPGDAKGFMNDARLKYVGWWLPGKPHARDALRHLATYVARYRVARQG